jgi:hypothetical protein
MIDTRPHASGNTRNRGGRSVSFSSSLSSTSGAELSSSPSGVSSSISGPAASSGGTNSTSTSIVDLTADSSDDEEDEVSVMY